MDPQLMLSSVLPLQQSGQQHWPVIGQLVPYIILIINCALFQAARSLLDRLLRRNGPPAPATNRAGAEGGDGAKRRLLRLFASELISTCELCADCAELNVVYEKHGSVAYGASLFLLTYLWMGSFGEAHTSPGYLVEDYFVGEGNRLLKTGDAYARFIGQSMAMPLAWRLASLYWKYELISEHRSIADVANCKSSLSTSTLNGFLIELLCCLLCRLAELAGHKLLERQYLGQRAMSALCAFLCSLLVVLALELSGGYFNPVLAGALEYGCRGIQPYQHALVFWLGPLIGHVLARAIFKRYEGSMRLQSGRHAEIERFKRSLLTRQQQQQQQQQQQRQRDQLTAGDSSQARRQTRSGAGQRRRKSDKFV